MPLPARCESAAGPRPVSLGDFHNVDSVCRTTLDAGRWGQVSSVGMDTLLLKHIARRPTNPTQKSLLLEIEDAERIDAIATGLRVTPAQLYRGLVTWALALRGGELEAEVERSGTAQTPM